VFRDLVASYAATTDVGVINGTGSNGQIQGVIGTANIQTVAVSAVTMTGVYAAMATPSNWCTPTATCPRR
jgi:hypothetical protein